MVLALSYLRRLVFQPPRGSQSEWLDVSDHVSNRQTDRMLTDEILRLADRLGLHDGIEVHMTRGQIRLRPGARISDSFRTAISEFGDLHDDELQPPPMPRRSVPIKKAPGKSTAPPAPVQTLWDYHLTAD